MPASRRHLLFPTPEEIKNDQAKAYSDHLPILSTVPLGDGKEPLVTVSLNTLGPSAASGLHDQRAWEDDKGTRIRYKAMAQGLAKAIEIHGVDIIALQECATDLMTTLLQEALGHDWQIMEDDSVGMMTCYHSKRFNLINTELVKANRVRSLTLEDTMNDSMFVDFHNIWGLYNPFSHDMEAQFHKFLQQKKNTGAIVSVMIGDTNSRIAPLHRRVINVTTGVVPLVFNDENGALPGVQIPDYPDGGFYMDASNTIFQLETQPLDYVTGKIVEDNRTKEEMGDYWSEYRMVMCLDSRYQRSCAVDNKTIFEYEDYLKDQTGDQQIIVRFAANCVNEKAVAIRFAVRGNLINYLHKELHQVPGFQFRNVQSTSSQDAGQLFSCVFCPLDKVRLLHQAVLIFQTKEIIKSKGFSFDKQDHDAKIVPLLVDRLNEFTNVEDICDLFKRIGIGYKNNAGSDPDFAKLRHRKHFSLFGEKYRETNDTFKIAQAGIARAKAILAMNDYACSDAENVAYEYVFSCDIHRNKARGTQELNDFHHVMELNS